MKKLFPYPWYLGFWFWWLAGTAIYLGLSWTGGGLSDRNLGAPLGYLTGLIGLFVPIGFFNFTLSGTSPLGFATFPLVILALLFADVLAHRLKLAVWKKAVFNLAALLLLTLLVDLAIYQAWPSFVIFMNGGIRISPTFL